MVIIPSSRTIFVHVPRTSGTALSRALCRAFPDTVWLDSFAWMHATTAMARELFAGEVRVFTILRNPWSIFASHYGWARSLARHGPAIEPPWFRDLVLSQAGLPFRAAVRVAIHCNYLAGEGGFFERYCDSQTILFRYEDQPYEAIGELLGRTLDVALENETLDDPPEWDQATIEAVADYCRGDLQRFGYHPPAVTTDLPAFI